MSSLGDALPDTGFAPLAGGRRHAPAPASTETSTNKSYGGQLAAFFSLQRTLLFLSLSLSLSLARLRAVLSYGPF